VYEGPIGRIFLQMKEVFENYFLFVANIYVFHFGSYMRYPFGFVVSIKTSTYSVAQNPSVNSSARSFEASTMWLNVVL
jgi:hypothetical protein